MSNQTNQQIQSVLDEHKEEIPDGLYLKLCKINAQAYIETKKETNLYVVKYVTIVPQYEGDSKMMIKFISISGNKLYRNILY